MKKSRQMLNTEIEREFEDVSLMNTGSDTIGVAIGDVATLYKLELEESKADAEYEEKEWRKELEEAKLELEISKFEFEKAKNEEEKFIRDQQLAEQKKDRWIKLGLESAGIGITVTSWFVCNLWINKGFKFEETGAITSSTFRNLFGKFRFRK